MKKKGFILVMMCVFAFLGSTMNVDAANTQDRTYSFDNRSVSGNSEWRDKTDATKVYVYPKAGPKIYYTVQGKNGINGSEINRSNTCAIPLGVQASITNSVWEKGGKYARLKMQRITTAYVVTTGVWSPDSTKNYTIYN